MKKEATLQNKIIFAFPHHPKHRLPLHLLNQPSCEAVSGLLFYLILDPLF